MTYTDLDLIRVYIDGQVNGYRLFVIIACPWEGYLSTNGCLFDSHNDFQKYLSGVDISFEQVFYRIEC